MKQPTHGQHNQHNDLREMARTQEELQDKHEVSVGSTEIGIHFLTSAEAIRYHAYDKWEIAGKPAGDGVTFWLEAETELAGNREGTSGPGNSQDANRHSGVGHPHSLKM